MKNDLINERTLRINIESNTQNLNNKLMKIETHLTQIRKENEKIKLLNNNNINGKEINKIKNDKLKNQVILLESQNDNLIKEIDEILYEDKKMKNILQRKERIISLLNINNNTLEKSKNDLNKSINK